MHWSFVELKDLNSCPIEIIKGLTDKGQFQYLIGFKAPQERGLILLPRPLSNDPRFIQYIYRYSHASKRFVEVYLYFTEININILSENTNYPSWDHFIAPCKEVIIAS